MNNPETDPKPENEIQLEAGGDCPSAPCSTLLVCADDETKASVLDRLQPCQKAIVEGAKMRQESLDAWAGKKLPTWKHIGELGEIAYMEDGSRRWTLKAGWEDMRLFLVYLTSGEVETHFAYIDDGGTLCDHNGDDVGWLWCDAEYFMDIPARPSLSNSTLTQPNL